MKAKPPSPIPEEFREIWDTWLYYKKVQHKFQYKDASFEYIGFKKLIWFSDGNLELATEIIENAIGNGYKGFFRLKPNDTKSNKQNSGGTDRVEPNHGVGAGKF